MNPENYNYGDRNSMMETPHHLVAYCLSRPSPTTVVMLRKERIYKFWYKWTAGGAFKSREAEINLTSKGLI